MATMGCKAIKQVSLMTYPEEIETLNFKDIKDIILKIIQPKKRLVIAERTKFLTLKQESGKPIRKYLSRLRDTSRYCDLNELGQKGMTTGGIDSASTGGRII